MFVIQTSLLKRRFMNFPIIHFKKRFVPATALALVTAMTFPALADGLIVYQISDGTRTANVELFQPNAEAAVAESGFSEDDYYVASTDEINDEYVVISMKKKFDVTVSDNGETYTLNTGAATAEELAASAGITLDEDDETEPSRDTLITEPTEIEVIHVEKVEKQKTVSVDYETVTKKTKKLERGTTKVKQKGRKGEAVKTYELVYRNGELSEKNLISREVTKEPTDKIVLEGTSQPTVKTSSGKLAYTQCISVEATAYSGGGTTASGMAAGVGRIAVDPSVIPLGTQLYITSADGSSWVYGTAVAADTGGAIKGNRIDLYFNSESECESFGRQGALVYILE